MDGRNKIIAESASEIWSNERGKNKRKYLTEDKSSMNDIQHSQTQPNKILKLSSSPSWYNPRYELNVSKTFSFLPFGGCEVYIGVWSIPLKNLLLWRIYLPLWFLSIYHTHLSGCEDAGVNCKLHVADALKHLPKSLEL